MHTMLRTPSAAAPSKSACSASRFRSRQTNCIAGSIPVSTSRREAASAETCVCAALLSVQLTASAEPRSVSASRMIADGSAESLVCISAVTTNSPARSNRCRWLTGSASRLTVSGCVRVLVGGPPVGNHAVAAGQQVLPGRGLLEAPVGGWLHVLDVLAPQREPSRSLPRLDPDALHLGNHLAVPVLERAAAGPVAQVLRAAHGTRETGGMQDALAAHPAVPQRLLRPPLDRQQRSVEPGRGRGR